MQISFANEQFFNPPMNEEESKRREDSRRRTNENLEESHRAITILLTHASGSIEISCFSLHTYTHKIVSAEFQKPRHVDPVSSSLSSVGRANSIRPFSTRSSMLSRNPIRKAGGMHQLVKLRYLTSPPSPPFSLWGPASLSSVTILSFRAGSKLRLVTKISISRLQSPPRVLQDRQRKVLDLVPRATFPP